jgi:hypothetical protein
VGGKRDRETKSEGVGGGKREGGREGGREGIRYLNIPGVIGIEETLASLVVEVGREQGACSDEDEV